jgi:hypothetical protein
MHTRNLLLALLFIGLVGCSTPGDGNGPRTLFNGRDLSGWVALHDGLWSVENGVIVGRNGTNWTTNPEKSGSWLRSEKEYGDFTLEFEYAINQRGNSGVFIRSALEKNPAFTGHEMQIVDDYGREPRKSSTGALYDVVAASKNMSKPAGEWNQVKIVAQGPRIEITLNGEKIVDYTSDRRQRGYVGLQNHDSHAVIKFRNIRITEH